MSSRRRNNRRKRAIKQAESIFDKYGNKQMPQRPRRRPRRRALNKGPRKTNVQQMQKKQQPKNNYTKVKELPSTVLDFVEAITNPFGSAGCGALVPDCTESICMACYDTGEINISPITGCSGFFVTILPRCSASGLLSGAYDSTTQKTRAVNGFVGLDVDGTPFSGTQTGVLNMPELYPYLLVYGWVTDDGYAVVGGTTHAGEYGRITKRMSQIVTGMESLRLIGGGIKVKPKAPLLTTGGIVYGGQIRLDKFVELLKQNAADAAASVTTGPFDDFTADWSGTRQFYTSNKGITVRLDWQPNNMRQKRKIHPDYISSITTVPTTPSPNECDENESKNIFIDKYDRVLINTNNNDFERVIEVKKSIKAAPGNHYEKDYILVSGLTASTYDLVGAAYNLPIIYWTYQDSTAANLYNLELRYAVHTHGTPVGDFPYCTNKCHGVENIEVLDDVLQDRNLFPLVTPGNSFVSVFRKITAFLGALRAAVSTGNIIYRILGGVAMTAAMS